MASCQELETGQTTTDTGGQERGAKQRHVI